MGVFDSWNTNEASDTCAADWLERGIGMEGWVSTDTGEVEHALADIMLAICYSGVVLQMCAYSVADMTNLIQLYVDMNINLPQRESIRILNLHHSTPQKQLQGQRSKQGSPQKVKVHIIIMSS